MNTGIDNFPVKWNLSGADCFFLAMEGHYKKYGKSGNTCHLFLSLNGKLKKEELEQKISQQPFIYWLNNIYLDDSGFFKIPTWKLKNKSEHTDVVIDEIFNTNEILPKEIINKGLFIGETNLLKFTLIQRNDRQTDIVFSWHHILMDAGGAETLLKVLGGELAPERVKFIPDPEKKISLWKSLYIMHFSKEFVKKTSRKPLAYLIDKAPTFTPEYNYHIIELTKEETIKLDKRAVELGGSISKGSFFLASTTRSVNHLLETKGNRDGAFWIPIPQNRRPKGILGPILSNLQAFMFYRIPREKVKDLKECTRFITSQMFDLIRHKRPDDYSVMSNLLRVLPASFYYFLIKGPAGGSTASFLFSDPGSNEFRSFMGREISDVTNYPPSTFPPGLLVVFERFNGKQKIIISHVLQLVNKTELVAFEKNLRKDLFNE